MKHFQLVKKVIDKIGVCQTNRLPTVLQFLKSYGCVECAVPLLARCIIDNSSRKSESPLTFLVATDMYLRTGSMCISQGGRWAIIWRVPNHIRIALRGVKQTLGPSCPLPFEGWRHRYNYLRIGSRLWFRKVKHSGTCWNSILTRSHILSRFPI